MLCHRLIIFKIQKYFQNEPKFNGAYSRNNVPQIKDGAKEIDFNENQPIGTHSVAPNVNANSVTLLDGFSVDCIPKEVKRFIGNESTVTNTYRIQENDSTMCGN